MGQDCIETQAESASQSAGGRGLVILLKRDGGPAEHDESLRFSEEKNTESNIQISGDEQDFIRAIRLQAINVRRFMGEYNPPMCHKRVHNSKYQ